MKKEVYEKPEIKSEAADISLHGGTISGPPLAPGDPLCESLPLTGECYN